MAADRNATTAQDVMRMIAFTIQCYDAVDLAKRMERIEQRMVGQMVVGDVGVVDAGMMEVVRNRPNHGMERMMGRENRVDEEVVGKDN